MKRSEMFSRIFMIDEFQDTSVIQWKNFRLLIENSMAQGYDNLVVGDIQAIALQMAKQRLEYIKGTQGFC